MKLFIDSGNLKEIESLVPLGIIDGITTNPSLLAKEPGDYREILKKICQIVKGPTSAEVVATDYDGMIREGRDLASIDPHIVVKVPFTKDGVKACKTLRREGIASTSRSASRRRRRCIAAKVGATYISPFVGRLDDIATIRHEPDPRDRRDLRQLRVRDRGARRQSMRGPMHVVEAARMGADICTCPAAVIEQLFKHPLTDIGLEKFLKDWEKAQAAKA